MTNIKVKIYSEEEKIYQSIAFSTRDVTVLFEKDAVLTKEKFLALYKEACAIERARKNENIRIQPETEGIYNLIEKLFVENGMDKGAVERYLEKTKGPYIIEKIEELPPYSDTGQHDHFFPRSTTTSAAL